MTRTEETEPTVAELGEYLLSKVSEQSRQGSEEQKRLVIAIAGIPGSGKTHLSQLISEYLNRSEEISAIVPMDGFHFTKAELLQQATTNGIHPSEALSRRGAHWTFDSNEFVRKVTQLKEHTNITHNLPSFDHATGNPVIDDIVIHPYHSIVLVEGNYVHLSIGPWNELRRVADELWWITTRSEDVWARLVRRHVDTGLEVSIEDAKRRVSMNDLLNGEFAEKNRFPPSRTILN